MQPKTPNKGDMICIICDHVSITASIIGNNRTKPLK